MHRMMWFGGMFHGDVPFGIPNLDKKSRYYKRIQDQKLVVEFSYDRMQEREALAEAIELWLGRSA